jgi:hypothetical protein
MILFFSVTALVKAQDIKVHFMISENQSAVTNKYGKPVHIDKSNPDMVCMFYQTNTHRMIFVADQQSIYQSEASVSYATEENARKEVDELINSSVLKGFVVDTVSISDFYLHKTGVKADLRLSENKISKKFEVSVKAHRSED